MVNGEASFKRPGAVPFNWEIRPGVPKTRYFQPDDPTLLQPPKVLPPLRLKPLPPSPSSLISISDSKSRPVSPFAPPSTFKLKSPRDSESHSSRPPTPYFRSSFSRDGLDSGVAFCRCFPMSLFGFKKSKSGDVRKTGQESTSSESDNFYESESTRSEDSSQVSASTTWASPKSSFSRSESDLSSYEKKTIMMIASYRLG